MRPAPAGHGFGRPPRSLALWRDGIPPAPTSRLAQRHRRPGHPPNMLAKIKPYLMTIVVTIIVLEVWPRIRSKIMPA